VGLADDSAAQGAAMIAPACTCFASGQCSTCSDYFGTYLRAVRRDARRKALRRYLLGFDPQRIVDLEWALWNVNDRLHAVEAALVEARI
jgi:hypothetical protein